MASNKPHIPALELGKVNIHTLDDVHTYPNEISNEDEAQDKQTSLTSEISPNNRPREIASGRSTTRSLATGSSGSSSRRVKGLSASGSLNEDASSQGTKWHENISTPSQRATSLSARSHKPGADGEDVANPATELTPRWDELWNSKQKQSQSAVQGNELPVNSPGVTIRMLNRKLTSGSNNESNELSKHLRHSSESGDGSKDMSLFDTMGDSTTTSKTTTSIPPTAVMPYSGELEPKSSRAVVVEEEVHITIPEEESAALSSTVEASSFNDLAKSTRNARITLWLASVVLVIVSIVGLVLASNNFTYRSVHASSEFCIVVLILTSVVGFIIAPIACWSGQVHKVRGLWGVGYASLISLGLSFIAMLYSLVADRSKIRIRAMDYCSKGTGTLVDCGHYSAKYDSAMRSLGVAALLLAITYAIIGMTMIRIVRKITLHKEALNRVTADRKRLAERVQNRKLEAAAVKYGSNHNVENTIADVMVMRHN